MGLVVNSKNLWGRSGLISLADDLLPHRAARTERVEAAKVIDDIRSVFVAYADTLRRLASFVNEDEISLQQLSTRVLCGAWRSYLKLRFVEPHRIACRAENENANGDCGVVGSSGHLNLNLARRRCGGASAGAVAQYENPPW